MASISISTADLLNYLSHGLFYYHCEVASSTPPRMIDSCLIIVDDLQGSLQHCASLHKSTANNG